MTDERYNALMDDRNAELDRQEVEQWYHFCPSWDGLLINPEMMEWEFCQCEGRADFQTLGFITKSSPLEIIEPPF